MQKNTKRILAKVLVFTLAVTTLQTAAPGQEAEAAKKPKLSKKKVNVTVKAANEITPSVAPSTTPVVSPTVTASASAEPTTGSPLPTTSASVSAGPTGSPTPLPYVKKPLNTNINVTVDKATDPETMKDTNKRETSTETVFTDDFENSTINPTVIKTSEGDEITHYTVDGVLTDRLCGEVLSIVDGGYNGGKCLKVSNRDRSFDGVRIDLENVGDIIAKGGTYRFTAYVKYGDNISSNDKLTFSQEVQTTENAEKAYSNLDEKDAPKDWTEITGKFSVPDSFYHYAIYLENPYSSETRPFPDLLVDNVKIECLDKVVPVDNLTSIYDTYKDLFPYIGTSCSYADILGDACVNFM